MKSILFTYQSPLGTFWIQPEPAGRVRLGVDKKKLRTYGSPKAAARAVAERTTGWEPWDTGQGLTAPAGLEKWKTGSGYRRAKPAPQQESLTRTLHPDDGD
jgi:hypothetical protein